MPLSPTVFQLPIPPILFLIPPRHTVQWVIRSLFLLYTCTIAIPLIVLLVPLSVLLHSVHPNLLLLATHPDNLPPVAGVWQAVRRCWTVYMVGTVVWAITGIGNAPESGIQLARILTRITCFFVELFEGSGERGKLEFQEEVVPAIQDCERVGAIKQGRADDVVLFSLSHVPALKGTDDTTYQPNGGSPRRKAILFLAGGGYVTGTPLAHPFIFSLIRLLTPPSKCSHTEDTYTVYAPYVRKSLDRERAFPVPLLDALSAWKALGRKGYKEEDVVLVGDSAGGGLCWTLLAYLAVLDSVAQEDGRSGLGVPGRVILISPWVALPPTPAPAYPDFVDPPQLLNAARCYMARYPILSHRPDPFIGDSGLWLEAAHEAIQLYLDRIPGSSLRFLTRTKGHTEKHQQIGSEPVTSPPTDTDLPHDALLEAYLEPHIFARLKSHHPLVSPGTDPSHPFTHAILSILRAKKTKILWHIGTAEWFYSPTISLAKEAMKVGVNVCVKEEVGGFHVEGCTFPADWGGASGRLVARILGWLREP